MTTPGFVGPAAAAQSATPAWPARRTVTISTARPSIVAPAATAAWPGRAGGHASTLLASRRTLLTAAQSVADAGPAILRVELDAAEMPVLRRLSRQELDVLIGWAAEEGWNPGRDDAEAFWATDPAGFWGIEVDGVLVGGASAVSHGDRLGVMGLTIARPELRGQGIDRTALATLVDGLSERLSPGAGIVLDAVPALVGSAEEVGFRATHRTVRMSGVGQVLARGASSAQLRNLAAVPAAEVVAYHPAHVGAERPEFLRHWIRPAGGLGLAAVDGGKVVGMGVVRRCVFGFLVGPLFAGRPVIADGILRALSAHAAGSPLHLDVPMVNTNAVALAGSHGLSESSARVRMVRGVVPDVSLAEVFGASTSEIG